MRKTPVKQEDQLGCGVACVSFILDISYLEALCLFKKGELRAKRLGFYCKDIIEAFNNIGIRYTYKYIKQRIRSKIYKKGTIVFIKKSKKYPSGHYLCRAQDVWMDPWINFRLDKDILKAKAGFRKRLPGKPIYAISPARD